jgi:putative ABC transport system permease protein
MVRSKGHPRDVSSQQRRYERGRRMRLESIKFALRGISANKLRSLLTTLGILIGVAAVIVLLAVGTGSSSAIKKRIQQLGSDTLTVNRSANGNGRAGTVTGGGGAAGGGGFGGAGGGAIGAGRGAAGGAAGGATTGTRTSGTNLTLDDAEALLDTSLAPHVKRIAPVITATSVVAGYTGVTMTVASFIGTTPSYLAINNYSIASGSPLTDSDYLEHRTVTLIGKTVADTLFGSTAAAVGQTLQYNGTDFIVSGVLKPKGSSGTTDLDDIVLAPLPTVEDKLVGVQLSLASVSIQVTNSDDIDLAQSEIYTVLDARHKVTSTSRDFTVINQTSVLETASDTNKTFTVLLGAVAAISLFVGGIGVMNIMLVTVTERTREIGIRKAIGAGRADIIVQFLAEAVLLSGLGAALGVAVGLVGSRFKIVGIQPVVAGWSVFLAFGVAVVVGLFFGIYPANRAASLKPIDALRYE